MVDTVLDEVLEDEYRYKLFMYQIFLLYDRSPVDIEFLMQQLGITRFKADQYVHELMSDLQQSNLSSRLIKEGNATFMSQFFSQKHYQKLRKIYFEKSLEVKFLLQVGILQNYSVEEFAEVNFISRSTGFAIVRKINAYLDNWNISLKSNHLIGEENAIRLFCFQFLFYFYGTSLPNFLLRIYTENGQAELLNSIEMIYNTSFTLNQISQIKMFMCIQGLRMSQHCIIEMDEYTKKHAPFLKSFSKKFKENQLFLVENDFLNEADYLQLFLVLNEFIEDADILLIPVTDTYISFLGSMRESFPALEERLSGQLKDTLKIICFKWENFSFSLASFISEEQFSFFQQSFPEIHEVVYRYIKGLENKSTLAKFERVHFYYDLIFCLLQDRKIWSISQPVRIFLDFSGGKIYNSFIKMNIQVFDYLNLSIDDKLNSRIDIYLSDFYNAQVTCHQIIWKNPPLDYDWRLFVDAVIQIKEEKSEEVSSLFN